LLNLKSLDEVRIELLSRLKKIHPDQTQGKFPNSETEAEFFKTQSAVHWIDELKNQNTSLVQYVERPVSPWKPIRTEEKNEEITLRSEISKAAANQHRSSKIKSAAIAVGITTALAFSTKLIENPFISDLLSFLDHHLPWFRPLLDFVFTIGILTACKNFFGAWTRELKTKNLSEEILTEPKIQKLFKQHPLNDSVLKDGVFSFDKLIETIQSERDLFPRRWVEWMPPKITKKLPSGWRYRWVESLFKSDVCLAQQAAELIITKLESRNAVRLVEVGALIREYKLSEAAIRQLSEDTRESAPKRVERQ
jgi:hypothetical protein